RPGPVPRSVQTMNTAGGPVSEETTGVSHEFSGLGDVVSLTSAPQQIADHILSGIAVGALPEGTLLPGERTLAADLQVSRSSVRACGRPWCDSNASASSNAAVGAEAGRS